MRESWVCLQPGQSLERVKGISKGNWGLPTHAPIYHRQKVRILYESLSVAESEALYSASKAVLGPKGTVTHAMHAAVYMAVLKHHPPGLNFAAPNQFFAFASPVDGRRNLSTNYADGTKPFFGLCQGLAVLRIDTALQDSERLEEAKYSAVTEFEIMKKAAKASKQGYDHFLEQPSSLSAALSVMELLADASKDKHMFPQGASLENPRFTSHGILDKHIPSRILDAAGRPVVVVKDVWFSLNQIEPAFNLRLYSFQERSRVGLIWNGVSSTHDDVRKFLDFVVHYLRLFARMATPSD